MGRVLLKMTHPIRKDSEGDPWLFSSFWDTAPHHHHVPAVSQVTFLS